MNAVEMQYAFDNRIRQHNKIGLTTFASSDIEVFLNNAQENLTLKYAKTFEGEEFSRIVLMKLYRVQVYTYSDSFTNATSLTNGIYFNLPADYKLPTNIEEATITTGTVTYNPRVKPITDLHYNLNESVNNPYKQPYQDMIWRVDYGVNSGGQSGLVHQIIVPTGTTLVTYKLHYIKQPTAIVIATNTTSELSTNVHNELIDEAVRLAMNSYEANKITK